MSRTDDSPQLRRARLLIALQAAAGVALGVLVGAAVTFVVVLARQDADLERRLDLASHADVAHPRPGTWMVEVGRNGTRQASSGAPSGLPTADQLDRAWRETPAVVEEAHSQDGTEYLTRTEARGTTVLQTGVDLSAREAERHRLLAGLAVAGAAAAVAAAGLGTLLARRAITPLEEAMARQRRFVADASHELRTPLTRLALRAQMIQRAARTGSPPATLEEDARHLSAEAADMAAIVEDLLLSAQLEQTKDHGEQVDLAALAVHAVESEQPRAAEMRVHLAADVEDVPPVTGVEIALRRALSSLVDNALRHAPSGGHVDVAVRSGTGSTVQLSVTDDGPGMDFADPARPFERFARGHDDRGRFGLGLSLVREIVEAHTGGIRAEPGRPHGTRFVVTLPATSESSHRHDP